METGEVSVNEAFDRIIDEVAIPSSTTLQRDDCVVVVLEIHEPGCGITDDSAEPWCGVR